MQVAKSEGSAAGDSAESLAEDLLKKFTDSQPDIKKEAAVSEYTHLVLVSRISFRLV